MAVTLPEVAKLQTEPLKKGVIMNMLRASKLLQYMKFENVSSLKSVAVRLNTLPTSEFRRINEGYTRTQGTVEQVYESIYPFGGEIELDRVFKKLSSTYIQDPRALQIKMRTQSMALTWADYFVNGDHANDPDGFEGVKKRTANSPARQTIRASSTTDVIDPTSSAANARYYIDKWEEALYKANSGDANIIVCNEGVKWGLGRVLRYSGISGGPLFDTTKDMFDREVLTYKGIPIIDAGLKVDLSTEIITNSETADDGGSDATSAYFIPINSEQGVTGIQLENMEVYDPLNGGEGETTPSNLIRVEWFVGLAGFGSYGPTRLYNIESPASWT